MRFLVLMADSVNVAALLIVASCNLVEVHQVLMLEAPSNSETSVNFYQKTAIFKRKTDRMTDKQRLF
jgi:hypothetical protein